MWYCPMCVLTLFRSSTRDPEIGFLHDRRGDDRRRVAVGDELSLVEDDDAVGERAHDVHLVLDQQDGLVAARLDVADEIEDHRHFVDAHAGGRLVEHEHFGLEREQDRHLELALVAVRQRGSRDLRLAGERDALEIAARPLDQLDVRAPRRQQVLAGAGARLHREAHVLQHAQAREQVGELEGAADAAPGALRGGEARDVFAEEGDAAGRRRQLPGDEVEVGGLAGAVRPDDRGQRARLESTADAIHRDVTAEADGQVAGFEDRIYCFTRIGTFISSGLISRTSSGIAQATFGSTLILKWNIDCIAWWSSLRKVILPLGVSNERPSIAAISFSVSVAPAFFSASTMAMPADIP